MNCIYRKCIALTLFLIPTGAPAQTQSAETGGSQRYKDQMQRDVQAARETLDAISRLGQAIRARQATAQQQTPGKTTVVSAKKPFADVPRTDSAYADLTTLEQRSLLIGYPSGYFSSKRILTRYEFAVAILRTFQRLNADGTSRNENGSSVQLNQADRRVLTKLVEEFREELEALGAPTRQYLDRLKQQSR